MKKLLPLLLILFTSFTVFGQKNEIDVKLQLNNTPTSSSSDKLLTIGSDSVVKKSSFLLSDIGTPTHTNLTGNSLLLNSPITKFYNVDTPNSNSIILDLTGTVVNGSATIYSTGASEPGIQGYKTLYKIGTYTADNTSINKMSFVHLKDSIVELTIKTIFSQAQTGAEELDIPAFNFTGFWRASEAVTSSGNVITVPDLSGNGYTVGVRGNPEYETNGINGRPSIRVTNDDGLSIEVGSFTQRTNLAEIAGYVVYQIENTVGATYHLVYMIGAASYTTTGSFTSKFLYNPNSTNNFIDAYHQSSLSTTHNGTQLEPHSVVFSKTATNSTSYFDGDITGVTTTGTQNINNNTLFLGLWDGKGMNGLISEFAMRQDPFTPAEIATLSTYLNARYGIDASNSSPPITVVNEGVGGNTTENVISRLPSINAAPLADLFVINIGVNDWRLGSASSRNTPADYKIHLDSIVSNLQANNPTASIIIQSIPPILNEESDYVCAFFGLSSGCDADATGDAFRTKQQEVANERGANVYFQPLHAAMVASGQVTHTANSFIQNQFNHDLQVDGVHVTATGATFIAQHTYDFTQTNSITFNVVKFVGDSNTAGDGLGEFQKIPPEFERIYGLN